MSAIPAFVLECARGGRWVRGLMALQDQQRSPDPHLRRACVALAQLAAPHSWAAALALLQPTDAVEHTQEVCKTLNTVARHPELPVDVYETAVAALLAAPRPQPRSDSAQTLLTARDSGGRASSSSAAASAATAQRHVFLSATQWCGWETAQRLLACLPTPPPSVCVERVHALHVLRHRLLHDLGPFRGWGCVTAPPTEAPLKSVRNTSLAEQLDKLRPARARRYSLRDHRELARLGEQTRQQLLQRAGEEEAALVQGASAAVAPSVTAVCAAVRVLTRPSASPSSTAGVAPFRAVRTLAEASRLTPDLALVYSRAVGLLAPGDWHAALDVLSRAEVRDARLHRQLATWLVSRGDWAAALGRLAHHEVATPPQLRSSTAGLSEGTIALDYLQRTAAPTTAVLRMEPQTTRPWYRLKPSLGSTASVAQQIARALARGVRLDEVQLSIAGKEWAAHGRWEAALALYYRFPLPEFQKYAARALVAGRPALPPASSASNATAERCFSAAVAVALLVPYDGIRSGASAAARPAPPLGTFAACTLMDAAASWSEALAVFRQCVRGETRCNPQVLSTLLRRPDLPPSDVRGLLKSYPAAANDGVRRRARERFGVE